MEDIQKLRETYQRVFTQGDGVKVLEDLELRFHIHNTTMDNDINNLLQSSLPATQVSYGDKKIQVSYASNNTSEVQLDGYNWTGMIIKNEPVENAGDVSNQAVFFNAEIIPGEAKDVRMFIVDSGDFNNYPMKETI